MATRLFVGNLPENTCETDLRSVFSEYGEVTTLDLKRKADDNNESNKFAFVSLSGSNYDIESCIKHFANQDFNGKRLYVTRARESFLERLQKEREQAKHKELEKKQQHPQDKPINNVNGKLNPLKRNSGTVKNEAVKIKKSEIQKKEKDYENVKKQFTSEKPISQEYKIPDLKLHAEVIKDTFNSKTDKMKQDSENKRMDSMKKKCKEFKQKQNIIKTGLTTIDRVHNTKIVFSDGEDAPRSHNYASKSNVPLFDIDDSGDDLDFSIKEQYEGKQGQKVLDLQSRYKSDKRFTLDGRFIEKEISNGEEGPEEENETVELEQKDEKNKQLDILQDVLGITLKRKLPEEDYNRNKLRGMLRFDPSQPDHAKFLAPVEPKKQETKKGKKKLKEKGEEIQEEARPEDKRPEVSKEQFYNVSETLKEAIAQPTTFSLRTLFGASEPVEEESKEDQNYTSLEAPKKPKVKNPLEPKEKNPFVYDSSESENEDELETKTECVPTIGETKAVWKENLFFSDADNRLKEGLAFFINVNEDSQKERRELKSLVKKRIYNKERKNQMFKKKIGGRRKTMKKSFRKKI